MNAWNDREYGLLAVAAEDVVKDAARNLPKEQTKRVGRAIQGLMAEPTDAYRLQLEQVPKLIRDRPTRELAGLDIARLIANKESLLTNSQSTGPAMEFHHLMHNNAVYDATKALPLSTLGMFQQGLAESGYKAGASPDAGVVLSRYGHRLGPKSAHMNPETGGNYTMYYGTQPVELEMSSYLKNEEQFAQDYLQGFIEQKAKPMYLAGMAAYDREEPLRQFLDNVAGGPVESFNSPAQYKKAVLDAGITEKDVDMIAMKLSGADPIEPVGRTQINTKSYRNIRRPGAPEAITSVLKM